MMKIVKNKTAFFNLVLVFLTGSSAFTQIGVNNPTPHTSAVLDLSGGANTGKGLLLPATTNVIGISTPARGLLVFDSTSNETYIYNQDSTKWFSANPWYNEYGSNVIQTSKTVKLDGATQINNLQINTNLVGQNTSSYIENINGAVPPGAIVMWSGSVNNIPYGWALCDGSYYHHDGSVCCSNCTPIQGLQCSNATGTLFAPDLRGRFIVGYDPGDTDYDQINADRGGEKEHQLIATELPDHTHNFSGTTSSNGGGDIFVRTIATISRSGGVGTIQNAEDPTTSVFPNHNHTFSGTTDNGNGGNQPHENRPPYYTLAYIIKLKNHP